MRVLSVLALGVVVGLGAIPQVDAAVQFGRARGTQVCVYRDINYQGVEQCYNAGEQINSLGAQSRSISSIRVYGGATVTVYENTEFRGNSMEFTSDVPDLGRRVMSGRTTWSDRIDSMQIGSLSGSGNSDSGDRRNPGDFRRNQDQQPRDGVCVYDRPNYAGRSECWSQGQNISNLTGQGSMSGQISSIRLFGGRTAVVVYRDNEYRGESLTVDRDIPDLAQIAGSGGGNGNRNGKGNGRGRGNRIGLRNWDRQISSLQVRAR